MTARRFLSWTYIVASVLVLSSPAAFRAAPAGSEYHVIRNILLGGDGGWDYVTVDPDAKRVYAPRGTHIQVVDEVSGKLVADMSDLKGLHGVAVAPEFNRGFVTGNDPDPLIYLFDLKSLKITGKITPPSAMDSDSLMYDTRSEEHTSELQSQFHLVCRLLLEKKKKTKQNTK